MADEEQTGPAGRPIPILRAEGFADRETPLIAGAGRAFCGAEVRLAPRNGDIAAAAGATPVGFAAKVRGAAGVPRGSRAGFRATLGAEHPGDRP